MATRDHGEVLDIVEAAEKLFITGEKGGIWGRDDEFTKMLHGEQNIRDTLPAHFPKKEEFRAYDLKEDARDLMGELNNAFEVHVEPHSQYVRDDTKADDLEVWSANKLITLGLQSGGYAIDDIRYGMAVKYYVPVQLGWSDFKQPARLSGERTADYLERVDRYERNWAQEWLKVHATKSVAYIEDNRKTVLVTRNVLISFEDLARDYGDYDRAEERSMEEERQLMLEICNKQFPFVRSATAVPFDGSNPSLLRNQLHLREVDDGINITHHVQGMANDRNGRPQIEEVGSYKNPCGRPATFIFSGVYNGGEDFEHSREPALLPLGLDLANRDWCDSFLMSHVASASPNGIRLEGEVARDFINKSGAERADLVAGVGTPEEGQWLWVPGEVFSTMALPQQVELVLAYKEDLNIRIAQKRWWANFAGGTSAKEMAERSTLGGLLHISEKSMKSIEGMRQNLSRGVQDILDAVEALNLNMANSHYKRGSKNRDDKDVGLYATATGEERIRDREVDKGYKVSLMPADVDFERTRYITQPDMSLSQQQLRFQVESGLWNTPDGVKYTYYDKMLSAAGYRNVTAAKKKIWADGIFQGAAPEEMRKSQEGAAAFADKLLGRMTGQAPPVAATGIDVQAPPGVSPMSMGTEPTMAPMVPQDMGEAVGIG